MRYLTWCNCTYFSRYGSIYNPNIKYSIPPPPFPDDSYKNLTDHDDFPVHEMVSQNEYGNATEDFTQCQGVSNWFAEAALICDPIKVQWWNLHQLNECHPSLVKVPTMVVSPISPCCKLFFCIVTQQLFVFRLRETWIHMHLYPFKQNYLHT